MNPCDWTGWRSSCSSRRRWSASPRGRRRRSASASSSAAVSAALAFVLQMTGRLLVALIAPLARSRSFPLRHAVLHLSRPGNQTRVILLAVGLGAFFIVGVRSLQASLLEEFSIQSNEDAPDMFLMDIQRDQADGVRAFLGDPAQRRRPVQLIPVLRARVTGVRRPRDRARELRGRPRPGLAVARIHRHVPRPRSSRTSGSSPARSGRDRRPTRRCRWRRACTSALPSTSATSCGSTSWAGSSTRASAASATSTGEIRETAASCSSSAPASLDEAPQTFIAPLKGPEDPAARARLQHDLVLAFPQRLGDRLPRDPRHRSRRHVEGHARDHVVGGLVLFSGVLILVGAVAMTKFQRVYEAAVFKTLGANTRTIARMLLFEYGVLGLARRSRRIARRGRRSPGASAATRSRFPGASSSESTSVASR